MFAENICYKCVETIYQQPKLLKAWLKDSPTVDLSTTVENPLDSNVCTGSIPVLGTKYWPYFRWLVIIEEYM